MSSGAKISFLIGGGGHGARVHLLVGGHAVRQSSPSRDLNETMTRVTWDVHQFTGRRARLRLVDYASLIWGHGHLNFDDFKGDVTKCGGMSYLNGTSILGSHRHHVNLGSSS